MSHFQLIETHYVVVTRNHDPEDRWSGEDTLTIWNVDGVKLCTNKDYDHYTSQEDFSPGEEYHAVYAVWSTGDSFSRNESKYCELFGVYKTRGGAEKRVEELLNDKTHSVPWNGYFEHLEELEIISGVL